MFRSFVLWHIGLSGLAAARSIIDFPLEVRQNNIVRVSKEACEECVTIEDFYQGNPLAFLLFYERVLVSPNQYKAAVVAGFHSTCKELRWSRIACGLVDMVEDRDYAMRYIDPKTAPAHILVRRGEPVAMPKEHVKKLMEKPGDKDVMMWHLGALLSPDSADISAEVRSQQALEAKLKKHDFVVAGFIGSSKAAVTAFRAAVQRLVLTQAVPVEAPQKGKPAGKQKKGVQLKDRNRIAFLAAGDAKAANATEGTITVFVRGAPQPFVERLPPASLEKVGTDDIPSLELTVAKAVHTAVQAALQQHVQEMGTASTPKEDL